MPEVGIVILTKVLLELVSRVLTSIPGGIRRIWNTPERIAGRVYDQQLQRHLGIKSRDKDRLRKLKILLKVRSIEEAINRKDLLPLQRWRRIIDAVDECSLSHWEFSYHKFWPDVRDAMARRGLGDESQQIKEGMALGIDGQRAHIDHIRKQSRSIGDTSEEVGALIDLAYVDRRDLPDRAIEEYREALSALNRKEAIESAALPEDTKRLAISIALCLADTLVYVGEDRMQHAEGWPEASDAVGEADAVLDSVVMPDERDYRELLNKLNRVKSAVQTNTMALRQKKTDFFRQQGQFELAEQELMQALPNNRSRERARRTADYVREDRGSEAARGFRLEKLQIAKDIEDEAIALERLGVLYAREGRPSEATEYFDRALEVWLARHKPGEAKAVTDRTADISEELGVQLKTSLATRLERDRSQADYAFVLHKEVAEISARLGNTQARDLALRKVGMLREELLCSTGRSFLSYSRSRKHEVELLIAALHDRGVPTWQDVTNLDEEQTEAAIKKTLGDPSTASAILWLTPEVSHSAFIRGIEAPLILERARRRGEQDQFFVIPVLAGGLDYSQIGDVLDPRFSEDLRMWNLRKVDADPISPLEAAQVAKRVLDRRLEAIDRTLPEEEPLRLELFTRPSPPAFKLGTALVLDWLHRFDGRLAKPGAWDEHLLPALKDIADSVQTRAPRHKVEVTGLAAIPAATALGCSFLAPRGIRIAWRQPTPGRADQLWSIEESPEPSGFHWELISRDVNARDLAVLVSVAQNVEPGFAASCEDLPPFRAIVRVAKPGGDRYDLTTPSQASDVAQVVVAGIRRARIDYRPLGVIHLFMAVPVGLAMMIGQLLNTLGPIQTYEHLPVDAIGRYRAAALLHSGL